MSTAAQIAASRQNAQLSSGPTSETGKASVRPHQGRRVDCAAVLLAPGTLERLRNTRKTVAVLSTPPEGLASSLIERWRASAPFALLRNTRTTDSPVGAFLTRARRPPNGLCAKSAEFLSCRVPRPAACALLRNSRKTVPVLSAPPKGFASSFIARRRVSAPFALPRGRGSASC